MFNKTHRKVEITAPPSNLRLHHPPPALLVHSKEGIIRQSSTPAMLDTSGGTRTKQDSNKYQNVPKPDEKKKKFSFFKKKKDKTNDQVKRVTRTPDATGRKQLILSSYPDSAPLVRRPHSAASNREEFHRTGSQRSTKSGDFLDHNDIDDEIDYITMRQTSMRQTSDYPHNKSKHDPGYDALEKYSRHSNKQVKDQVISDRPGGTIRPSHHRPAPPPPTKTPPPHTPNRHIAPPSVVTPQSVATSLPGLIGIKNHGNTCFMNAIIQCLSNTEQLLHYILSGKCQNDIGTLRRNKKQKLNPAGAGIVTPPASLNHDDDCLLLRPNCAGAITEYLVVLIKSLWNCQYDGKVSAVFKEVVSLWMERYRGHNQHDAQEFLLCLLGHLHDNLSLASRQHISKTPPPSDTVAMETPSMVYKLFGGEYRSTLHCPECSNDSNTFESFLCTSLSVPRRGTRPIYITMARRHQNTTKLMLFGLSIKVTATVHEIQKQLSLEARTLPHYLVIGDMSSDGFNQFYHSNDPVAMIPENIMLYAFEVTPYKGDYVLPLHPAGAIPDHRTSETIFIVLQNRVGQGEYSKKFGTPLCLRIWRDFTYSQLQSVVFKGIKKYLHEGVNSEVICRDYIFFKCRVIDGLQGQEYLDPYCPSPLMSPSVEKALAMSKMWGYESHVKIIAEWEQWVKDCVCTDIPDSDPPIHESAHVVKKHYDIPLEAALDDCLSWHTQEEKLEGDEMWTCPKCTRPQNGASKSITFSTLPEVLMIHLKRFEQDEYSQSKLNTLVKFPIKGLDMTPYMSKAEITRPNSAMSYQTKLVRPLVNGGPAITQPKASTLPGKSVHFQDNKKSSSKSKKFFIFKKGKKSKKGDDQTSAGGILTNKNQDDNVYDLYAVCNHHGDMNRGHYIAHCLNPVDNKWYIFDDHHVLPVASEDHMITQYAYILFYVKRNSRLQWLKSTFKSDSSKTWIQHLITQYTINLSSLPSLDNSLFSPQRQGSATSAHTQSTASGVSPDNVFFPSNLHQMPTELAPPAPFHLHQYSTASSSSGGGAISPHSTLTYPLSLPSPSIMSTPAAFLSQQHTDRGPYSSTLTKRAGSFHGNTHYLMRHYSESHSATRV